MRSSLADAPGDGPAVAAPSRPRPGRRSQANRSRSPRARATVRPSSSATCAASSTMPAANRRGPANPQEAPLEARLASRRGRAPGPPAAAAAPRRRPTPRAGAGSPASPTSAPSRTASRARKGPARPWRTYPSRTRTGNGASRCRPARCLASEAANVAPVPFGEGRDDGARDPHRPGPSQRLGVGAAGDDDDGAGVRHVEDDPAVPVPGQDHEAAVARVAEQRGTRDPDAVELEDDLGAGVDRGHRRRRGGGDEVRVGPGRDAPPAVVGEEQLPGGRRAAATGGRPDPRAGRRHAVGRVDRHLDEPRTADPLGEEVAGRDLASHRRRDPVAGEQRDPDLRPFDDERPGRDERERGVGRHAVAPGPEDPLPAQEGLAPLVAPLRQLERDVAQCRRPGRRARRSRARRSDGPGPRDRPGRGTRAPPTRPAREGGRRGRGRPR